MKFLQKLKTENNILIPLLLLCIGFVIYANCFHNQMFWDDDDFILKNRYIKDWKYFPKFFTENVVSGNYLLSNYWRPVLLTVFSIEWHLWKDWAPGYHVVSTLIHSCASILLYFLLFRLFQKRYLALLTSLVFLVHPVQTEAVVYANALSDSLACVFVFSALILYHRFRVATFKKIAFEENLPAIFSPSERNTSLRGKNHPAEKIISYLGCLLLYPIGIMSKETGFMLPAYMFLIEFLAINKPFSFSKKTILRFTLSILPFLCLAAVYLYLRATSLNFVNTFNFYNEQNILTSSFLIRLFTFFKVLTIYAGLLFFPIDLHVERSVSIETSFASLPVLWGALICAGLIVWALKKYRTTPLITFGVLWFFIGIFPSSNLLIPINALLYEHFLYMPLIGIFLIIIHEGFFWGEKLGLKKTFLKIFMIYLIFFSVRTMIRNVDWKDAVIFYENLLKHAPKSYRVINNLGMMYAERNLFEKAELTYKRAINLDPSNPVGWHNLGGTYRDTERKELARQSFEKAIALDRKFLFSYKSLAQLYLEQEDYSKTREVMEAYLNYAPDKIETLVLLSKIAISQKDFNAARDYVRGALSLDPSNLQLKQNLAKIEALLLSIP